MRATRYVALSLLVVLSLALLLHGTLPLVTTGSWTPANNLVDARSGSAAALLQDGRVLFTGGTGSTGALASAELFNTDGSVTSAAPMQDVRSNHTAITLQDGRVLVAGGTTSGGITSAAEIYDPASNSWTPVAGGMTAPRTNHTASLLKNGTVLVAGGQSTTGALNSLEIYDPAASAFVALTSGTLSSARQDHAAAVLADGRVLMAGGSDGTNALTSADVYNPLTGSVSAAGNMSGARTKLSATTLLDGRVLAAGGNDGTADLATAEIYDPATGAFAATGSPLGAARSGHLAFLLPNNNGVLIVGGSSAGAPLASAELFCPWTGIFNTTGAMASPRTTAAGVALKQNGYLLVAGGSDGTNSLASTELYGFATVKTDKADYAPGETVTISGSGWQPRETVTLSFVESPLLDTHGPFTAVADSFGNISNVDFVPDEHDVNILFYLTAKGSVSQAQTTFTDASNAANGDGSMTVSPLSVTAGSTGNTLTFTFTGDPGKDFNAGSQATILVPVGWTAPTAAAGAGHVVVAAGSPACTGLSLGTITGTGPWTIPINMTCPAKAQFTVTYSGVTVPTTAAATAGPTNTFTTQTKQSGGTLTNIGSQPFVVINPAAASQLAFTVQPSNTQAGVSIAPAVKVEIRDQFGNLTTSTASVTVAIGTNPSAGTLSGIGIVAASGGVATFSNLSINMSGNGYTLTAASTGLTGATSSTFNITPGPASAGNSTVSASPTSVTADGTTTSTITVTLKDANNNVVSGKTVTLAKSGGSSIISAASGPSNASGVVTFTVKDTVAEATTYTATDTTDSVTITQTATVTFTAGTPTAGNSTVSAAPTSVVADGTSTSTITVTLKDANNNPVSGKTVSLAAGGGTSTISAASGPSNASGVVTFTVKDLTVETVTYTATDTSDSVTITQTATVNFTVGPVNAGTSTVSASLTSVTADGTTLSTITVTLKDASSRAVSGKTVFLTAGSGSSTITTISGTTNASGQATFSVKDTVAQSVTYTAKDTTDNITITQTATVTFTAGTPMAGNSTVSASPTSVVADGTATSTITVTLKDANNNVVSGKTVSLAAGSGSSTITTVSGTTNASGQATFTVKDTVVQSVTYTATDTTDTITITQTATVTFTPGPLHHFAISAIGSPQTAGTAFTITTITAQDANNNTVTAFDGNGFKVNLTSTGTLVGTPITTAAFTLGVLSGQSVTITNTGTFTITATGIGSNSGISGTSNSFTVNPGAANKLAFSQQPSNTQAGSSITPAVTVRVLDQFGNLVDTGAGSTASVGIAIGANPGSGTLSGTTPVNAVGGIATFSNLSINKTGTGYTLAASSAGLTGVTSTPFNITPGAAAKLIFGVQPTNTLAGVSIAPAVTVQVQDQFGNLVTTDSSNVSMAISAGGVLSGTSTTTVAAAGGVATFSNLVPPKTGTFSLSASDGALTGATSNTFIVNAGALDHLVLSPATATIAAGGSQSYTAEGFDQFGNSKGDVTGATTFSISPNGSCTLANCTATASGAHTVTGADSGKTGTATLNVNAGALDHLTLSPLSASIFAGGSQAYTATGFDQYNNSLGDVTGATTFTITNGTCLGNSCTSTVPGTQTVTGNNGGKTTTASLTVNAGPTAALVLSPPTATIAAGASQSYTAQGVDSYGNPTGDVTSSTTFTIALPTGSCTGATCTSNVAGLYTVTGTAGGKTGTATLTVTAGDFAKLQLLVPGETAAPGTFSGKTGTPQTEYVNGAFNVTVNAVDANWNVVGTITDTVHIASNDPQAHLPSDAPLAGGTGTFSVTLVTVSDNPATTTLTASDVTDPGKTASTSPAITVIVVYTASISPSAASDGASTAYTLTVNNAAAPNTNSLRSVTVAIPTKGGTPSLVSVTAANPGPTPANWSVDLSQLPGYLRFKQNTPTDGVGPGGTISIQFTTTANEGITSAVVQEVWTTTAFSNDDYTGPLPLAGSEPTVTIGKAPVITNANSVSFTVGVARNFTVITTGVPKSVLSQTGALPNGVTFTDNGDGTGTLSGTPIAGTAGTYPISFKAANGISPDAAQNFTLTVINPATTTALASSQNPSTYGDAVTFAATVSFDSSAGTPNGTVQFKTDGSPLGSPVPVTACGPNKVCATSIGISTLTAASHSITAYYGADTVFLPSSGSLTQVVNKADATITANSTMKNYGDTVTFAGTEFTSSGLKNSDTVTSVTLTSTGAAATATVTSPGPTYPIVPSAAVGTGLANYYIHYASGTLTVKAINLTIAANSTTKNYGETVTFVGTEFIPPSGLKNSDTVTSVTLTSAGAAAMATVIAPGPTYPIVASAAVGSGLGNYNLLYADGTLTVKAIDLTITANSRTKNYGYALTFAGTEFTPNGLKNSDAVTSVTLTSTGAAATATVTSPGPTYPITPSAALGTGLGNYDIHYTDGTLTVKAVDLTITANSTTKNYGDAQPFAGTEFTTSGLKNSDTVTSVTLTSAGAPATATVTTPGPNYAIVPSAAAGTGLGNYNLLYVSGTLTINRAPLTVTANNASRAYGGANPVFTGTIVGIKNSDNITATYSTTAGSLSPVGTYPITPVLVDPGGKLGNYSVNSYNGTLTVNARPTQSYLSLSAAAVSEGTPVQLTFSVADAETTTPGVTFAPGGTVTITTDSADSFSGICALVGNNSTGISACTITVTPLDNNTPQSNKHNFIAAFAPTDNIHIGSGASVALGVSNAPPVITTVNVPTGPFALGAATITATANFTDPGVLDTHTCTVGWDDPPNSPPVTATVSESTGNGSCSGTHTFGAAGVYSVYFTITDKDGGNATTVATPTLVVVYDPNGGFVTGGGWINSLAGAYVKDPSLTGKANFGFVSKYQKGATVPTGETEFQFQVANFDFHSSNYQWLVVSGAKAQYKGTGTVNGTGNYGFLLTATDGQLQGGGVDQFRIKVWDINNNGAIVYDNVLGASDDINGANPQAISGGSIVIHK